MHHTALQLVVLGHLHQKNQESKHKYIGHQKKSNVFSTTNLE